MSDPDAPARNREPVPWPDDAPGGAAEALELATPQLLVHAGAVRGTAWREGLADAIAAARTAGWPEARIGRYASRMLYDARAEPQDLATAARLPTQRAPGSPVPPDEYHRIRADREALERSRSEAPELTAREDPSTR